MNQMAPRFCGFPIRSIRYLHRQQSAPPYRHSNHHPRLPICLPQSPHICYCGTPSTGSSTISSNFRITSYTNQGSHRHPERTTVTLFPLSVFAVSRNQRATQRPTLKATTRSTVVYYSE